MQLAQDTSNHAGTMVRINPDGSIPKTNPFLTKSNTNQKSIRMDTAICREPHSTLGLALSGRTNTVRVVATKSIFYPSRKELWLAGGDLRDQL